MNNLKYTDDKNTLIFLSLLKKSGIRKVVASPGTTNIALVASMQYDDFFEVYSSVDERSAAYIACGLSASSGEPVVLTCTGATASRNYFPGLTEAYYRKLPILTITGSHGEDFHGHLHAQLIDRTQAPKDSIKFSTCVKKNDTEWKATIEINKAIIELQRHGGGPVHVDLESAAYGSFNTEYLPDSRKINYYSCFDEIPDIQNKKVAIFIGSHKEFAPKEVEVIERFCEVYNSVVFVDHTSGYYGKYRIQFALIGCQEKQHFSQLYPDILIHLGEISGDFYSSYSFKSEETWRVSPDGELRDLFSNLTCVFETDELNFFEQLSNRYTDNKCTSYYNNCQLLYNEILKGVPELPFGNIWIAKQIHNKLPLDSILHVSIFNSLRSWNFFELPKGVKSSCNVGGFGIDGAISTLIGTSLINADKICFGVIGDLAFFYDLNSLGNRHVADNMRILLINNGRGTEFRNYDHPGAKWGNDADLFIAAGGHYGRKSRKLVKDFCTDLGYGYLTASNKEEFMSNIDVFLDDSVNNMSIVFEVFTETDDESNALKIIRNMAYNSSSVFNKFEYYTNAVFRRIKR